MQASVRKHAGENAETKVGGGGCIFIFRCVAGEKCARCNERRALNEASIEMRRVELQKECSRGKCLNDFKRWSLLLMAQNKTKNYKRHKLAFDREYQLIGRFRILSACME